MLMEHRRSFLMVISPYTKTGRYRHEDAFYISVSLGRSFLDHGVTLITIQHIFIGGYTT